MNFFKRILGKKEEKPKEVWRRDSIEDSYRTRRRRNQPESNENSRILKQSTTQSNNYSHRQMPSETNIYTPSYEIKQKAQPPPSQNMLDSINHNIYNKQNSNQQSGIYHQSNIQQSNNFNPFPQNEISRNEGVSNPYSNRSSSFRNSRGSYGSGRGSKARDSEDRIQGSTFLNIPKVKNNYGRQKKKPKKRRNYNKNVKKKYTPSNGRSGVQSNRDIHYQSNLNNSSQMTNLQNPFQNYASTRNMGSSGLASSFKPSSGNNYKASPFDTIVRNTGEENHRRNELSEYDDLINRAKKKKNEMFRERQQMDLRMQLDNDIFDQNMTQSTRLLNTSTMTQGSKLENRMRNLGRPTPTLRTNNPTLHKSTIFDEHRNQENIFETKMEKKNYFSARPKQEPMISARSQVEKENTFDRQIREIRVADVQSELEEYMKNPNENRLIEQVLAQNIELTNLKNKLFSESINPNNAQFLQKKINTKNRELRDVDNQLQREQAALQALMQEKGISNVDYDQILKMEARMNEGEKKERRRLMRQIKKLDQRIADLKGNHDNFDKMQDNKKIEKIQRSDEVIQKAKEDIRINLDDKKYVLLQMKKMLHYYQTLSQ